MTGVLPWVNVTCTEGNSEKPALFVIVMGLLYVTARMMTGRGKMRQVTETAIIDLISTVNALISTLNNGNSEIP